LPIFFYQTVNERPTSPLQCIIHFHLVTWCCKAELLNLLWGVGNLSEILSACRQHEIQYAE